MSIRARLAVAFLVGSVLKKELEYSSNYTMFLGGKSKNTIS